MATKYLLFAHQKYWQDPAKLQDAFLALSDHLAGDCYLILTQEELQAVPYDVRDCMVAILLSGSVQPLVLQAADYFGPLVIYAGWIEGNLIDDISATMIEYNAAPTTMDCWGVLRRDHRALFALDRQQLQDDIKVVSAYKKFSHDKIILIGEIEPWVVSNSRDLSLYENFGLTVEKVAQDTLAQHYRETTMQQAQPYYDFFKSHATDIVEPTEQDIQNSARMAWALIDTMEQHRADGAAIACFNLLKEGTNCCLGVSYINGNTDMCASCECDVDSLATMLMMKRLTKTKLYMANPGIHTNGLINFNHCTAPVDAACCGACDIKLRSHHESNIGTSVQATIPVGTPITACRISAVTGEFTVHTGVTVEGPYERACRTQCYIRFDDFDHYINTALGCHQVFAFEDISEDFAKIASLAGLRQI